MVELVDIYPSLTQICGLPDPAGMEGSSFAPLFDKKNASWKKAVFTQVKRSFGMGRAVSTARYRYNSWGTKGEELYDHINDPFEYRNLAKDSAYTSTLERMRKILSDGWTKSLPSSNGFKTNITNSDSNVSNVIAKNNKTDIKVYPNPSDGSVSFLLNSDITADALITVFDNSGRAVFKTNTGLNKGPNTIRLSLNQLASGIYNLECRYDTIIQRAKLMIEK